MTENEKLKLPFLYHDVRRDAEGRIELRFYTASPENVTAIIRCSPAAAADLAQQIVDTLQPNDQPRPSEEPQ
jgi:hypothetical protein